VIVVAKFDRLFRSVADAAQTIVVFDTTNPPILVTVSRHTSAKRPRSWRLRRKTASQIAQDGPGASHITSGGPISEQTFPWPNGPRRRLERWIICCCRPTPDNLSGG
jgi:hypothetical protein